MDSEAARDLFNEDKKNIFEIDKKFESLRPTVKNTLFKEFEEIEQRESQKTFNKTEKFKTKEIPFYSPNKINLVEYNNNMKTSGNLDGRNYDLKEASLKDSSCFIKEGIDNDFEYSRESRLARSSGHNGEIYN